MEKKLHFLKKGFFALLAFVGMANYANAQCAAGEVEVSVDVTTDAYGYETYWELVPSGAGCGTAATIFAGGNALVGCTGQGAQAQDNTDPGLYASNTTITEGPFCLTIGQDYDIISVDDWGDTGAQYVILSQGVDVSQASGSMLTYTFTAQAPIAEDIQALSLNNAEYTRIPLTQVPAAGMPLSANVRNNGTTDVTDAVLSVDVFMSPDFVTPVQSTSSTPTSITSGNVAALDASVYTPTMAGDYTVRHIVSSATITDSNADNDTLYYNFSIGNDGMYARDNGDIVVNLGLNAPSEGMLGNTFDINVAGQMDSVMFAHGMTAGDTTYLEIWTVVAGVPTTQVGMSSDYFAPGAEVTTLPVMDMSMAPLVLAPGKYFVGVHDSKTGFLSLGFASGIYTAGGTILNINGGAFSNAGDAGFPNAAVVRPYVNTITVGVNEETIVSNLTAQPNPTTGLFSVNVGNDVVNYSVATIEGKVIRTVNNVSNNVNVDLTNEENGVYFVTVKGNNTNSTFKVVKQ